MERGISDELAALPILHDGSKHRAVSVVVSDDVEIIAVNVNSVKRASDNRRLEATEPLPGTRGKLSRDCTAYAKKKQKHTQKEQAGKAKRTNEQKPKEPRGTKSSCSSLVSSAASSTAPGVVVVAAGEKKQTSQNMTAKCIKSRAYHAAARLAKALHKTEEEQKTAARKAFMEAAEKCRSEGIY